MAFLLAVVSGVLFGIVPARQVMKSDPWQVIRAGGSGMAHMRRLTLRDLLLVVQIAICAVLVTSSLVAIRGLARSIQSNFGFDAKNVTLVECDLQMGGYANDQQPTMQKRMLDTVAALPGVTQAAYSSRIPLTLGGGDSLSTRTPPLITGPRTRLPMR